MNDSLPIEFVTFPDAPLGGYDENTVRALRADGIPGCFMGRFFMATPRVESIAASDGHEMLRIGKSGLFSSVCIDQPTGRVVQVLDSPQSPPIFVNSSIAEFTKTVKAVVAEFPYYGSEPEDHELDIVASRLLDVIQDIDAEAALPDRFWSTFADDAAMGNLTTEAVLRAYDQAGIDD